MYHERILCKASALSYPSVLLYRSEYLRNQIGKYLSQNEIYFHRILLIFFPKVELGPFAA